MMDNPALSNSSPALQTQPQAFDTVVEDGNNNPKVSKKKRLPIMTCLNGKTKLEKRLILCSIFLLMLLVIIFTILIIKLNVDNDKEGNECNTSSRPGKHPGELTLPSSTDPRILAAIEKSRTEVELSLRFPSNIPCIIAGVSVNGSQIWTEGFGFADIENAVKCHKDTHMRIADISQIITATLIEKLAEQGKLELDKSIHEYLSQDVFPRKKWEGKDVEITVRQLLAHTSGIRFLNRTRDITFKRYKNITETIALFRDDALLVPTGPVFMYSHLGYNLLGAIVESIENDTFENVINAMMRNDLIMLSSELERREKLIDFRARYYQYSESENISSTSFDYGNLTNYLDDFDGNIETWWPAVGVISTVSDMLIFADNLLDSFHGRGDGLLKNTTMHEMLSPSLVMQEESPEKENPKSILSHGLGWDISSVIDQANSSSSNSSDYKEIYHIGQFKGASTTLLIIPEENIVVTILANAGEIGRQIKRLSETIARNFLIKQLNN